MIHFLESIHSCVMCANFEITSVIFEICIVSEPPTIPGTLLLLARDTGTNLTSLGSIQPRCILHEDYSFTFPPLSIARYSFIQLSELGPRGEDENDQSSNSSKGIICSWGAG